MKKSLTYSAIFVLLILLVVYFFQQSKIKTSLINEVSLAEQVIEKVDISIPKNTLKAPKGLEEKIENKPDKNILIQEEDEISYLRAYRDLVHFRKCMMIYYNGQNGKDLMSHYISNYISFSDTQTKPNEAQTHYYQIYLDDCYSLLLSKDEKVEEAGSRLTKRFKSIEPETNDEIALSEALEYDKRINEIFFQIYHEKNGKNKLSEDQKKAILKKENRIN